MVAWPTPYEPYLDPEVKIDPVKSMRAGLQADLKEWIEKDQAWIGLLSRIKEQAKDDPEALGLLRDLILMSILMIRLEHEEINEPCE